MTDRVAFLRARLDEDEAAAQDGFSYGTPERVLREVEAKRRIMASLAAEKHDVSEDCWYTCGAATEEREGETCCDDRYAGECTCGLDWRREQYLGLLALPYADHPDWRPGWAPELHQAR